MAVRTLQPLCFKTAASAMAIGAYQAGNARSTSHHIGITWTDCPERSFISHLSTELKQFSRSVYAHSLQMCRQLYYKRHSSAAHAMNKRHDPVLREPFAGTAADYLAFADLSRTGVSFSVRPSCFQTKPPGIHDEFAKPCLHLVPRRRPPMPARVTSTCASRASGQLGQVAPVHSCRQTRAISGALRELRESQ